MSRKSAAAELTWALAVGAWAQSPSVSGPATAPDQDAPPVRHGGHDAGKPPSTNGDARPGCRRGEGVGVEAVFGWAT